MAIDTTAAPSTPPAVERVVWYRADDGDHAFPTDRGYLRSACRDVRFTVLLERVEGTVRPCVRCLEAIAPRPVAAPTESEERASWGDR